MCYACDGTLALCPSSASYDVLFSALLCNLLPKESRSYPLLPWLDDPNARHRSSASSPGSPCSLLWEYSRCWFCSILKIAHCLLTLRSCSGETNPLRASLSPIFRIPALQTIELASAEAKLALNFASYFFLVHFMRAKIAKI